MMVSMNDPDGDWERLGQEVKARREELQLTQPELATLLGVSLSSVQRLERGTARPKWALLHAVEHALNWSEVSAAKTLAGGAPTIVRRDSVYSADDDIVTVDAERAYEMLQSIRKVFGEAAYVDALARAVRARASGDDQKTG